MEFSHNNNLEKTNEPNSNPVIQLTEDNWRRELLQSTRPVIVLTQSKDCSSCGAWQADLEKQAKGHPEFKFAVSEAAQFGFPEKKTPIISAIVPGIGTAFLQHVDLRDEQNNESFWKQRFDKTSKEFRDSEKVSELQKSSRELMFAVTKYGIEKRPHSAEETKKFEDAEKQLALSSEELAQTKLEIISELNGEIDPSIIDPEQHP